MSDDKTIDECVIKANIIENELIEDGWDTRSLGAIGYALIVSAITKMETDGEDDVDETIDAVCRGIRKHNEVHEYYLSIIEQ
jgi:hypothetical protein